MGRRAGWMLIGFVVAWAAGARGETALQVYREPSGSTVGVGVEGGAVAPNGSAYQAYGVVGWASCSFSGQYCSKYAVYAGGDLAYTGNLLNLSDLRFKESLAPLGEALPRLLALEVVTYEHVQTEESAHMNLPAGPQVGFVAQQVAEVLPELVTEVVHPGPQDRALEAEPIRYQALKPIDLIPHLVRAIQEQQAQIEALEEELRPLRTRLARTAPAERRPAAPRPGE